MNDQFWWIENSIPDKENESGCVRASVLSKYKNYSQLKSCVWKWFRSRAGDTSLRRIVKQAKPGVHKHLLLVGLGVVMIEELPESGGR